MDRWRCPPWVPALVLALTGGTTTGWLRRSAPARWLRTTRTAITVRGTSHSYSSDQGRHPLPIVKLLPSTRATPPQRTTWPCCRCPGVWFGRPARMTENCTDSTRRCCWEQTIRLVHSPRGTGWSCSSPCSTWATMRERRRPRQRWCGSPRTTGSRIGCTQRRRWDTRTNAGCLRGGAAGGPARPARAEHALRARARRRDPHYVWGATRYSR